MQLSLPQSNKRLIPIVETDGCFADGIAVATGCELSHRTLRLVDFGKVTATLSTQSPRTLCAYPDE